VEAEVEHDKGMAGDNVGVGKGLLFSVDGGKVGYLVESSASCSCHSHHALSREREMTSTPVP